MVILLFNLREKLPVFVKRDFSNLAILNGGRVVLK